MSYYPVPELQTPQKNYIKAIENIFKVPNASKEWVPYKLTPHQIEWHSQDVAIMQHLAKSRVVTKSRNTSFTTSASISSIMAVPFFPDQLIPFFRINQNRATDLIKDIKKIVKHISPMETRNGDLFPFDPRKVNMNSASSIKFPNGVEFRAFPANTTAAEVIRGVRIVGSAGIIDESNFMTSFKDIYIALRDSAAGSIKGKKCFQINIGTTRKGHMTPFNLWYEKQLKNKLDNMQFFSWPVVDTNLVDLNKDLREQSLKIIVPWHDIDDLELKRREDLNKFKEEYMGILVDSEEQFYEQSIILGSINSNLIEAQPEEGKIYIMGVDPAMTNDMFSISIFERLDGKHIQRYLYYKKGVKLPIMVKMLKTLIEKWMPYKCRIDANGLGAHLGQELKDEFPGVVQLIKGSIKIKGLEKGQSYPLKEYIHTYMKRQMLYRKLELLPDEMQIRHYSSWKNNFTAEHTEYGHGDIVIGNGLCILPDNFKYMRKPELISTLRPNKVLTDDIIETLEVPQVEW